jgi:hypothetical protein
MSLNVELLNCRRLTTGVLFPARQFSPGELNRLYATVTDRYPFQTLQHLPDGIRMANPDNDCVVQGGQIPQPGRIQVNDNNIFHFEPAKERTLDLFDIVCTHLNIQQFLTFGVKLTAFLPSEGETAAEVLENSVFAGFRSQLALLGEGRQGTGFRVVLRSDGAYDLRIEPFFTDLSQLYVELDVQYPEPFSGLIPVEERMNRAYRFLNEDVRELLRQLDQTKG